MTASGRSGRAKSPRRAKWLMAFLVAIAIAAVLKTQFVVKSVDISGLSTRSVEAVRAMTGIEAGASIFGVEEARVRAGVEADPYLQLVSVKRRYPDAVEISLKESRPRAAVSSVGVMMLIDAQCRLLEYLNQLPTGDVYLITGAEVTFRREGERIVSASPGQIDALEALMAAIDAQGAANQLSELNIANLDNLYMISRTGVQVVLGNAEALAEKLLWFDTVLKQLSADGITGGVLDVSSGRNAVYSAR